MAGARKQAKVAWLGDSGLLTNPFSGFPDIAVLQGCRAGARGHHQLGAKLSGWRFKASVAALTKYQLQGLPLVLSQSLHRGCDSLTPSGGHKETTPSFLSLRQTLLSVHHGSRAHDFNLSLLAPDFKISIYKGSAACCTTLNS
jgi:hypothetical protein